MYIESKKIKVYPTSKRGSTIDLNSRYNSEQNIISVVNRLADKDSFIIEGITKKAATTLVEQLNKGEEGTPQLYSGKLNIHGYYFDIIEDIDISLAVEDVEDKSGKLICGIQIQKYKEEFNELVGLDDTSSGTYKGLQILFIEGDEIPTASNISHYLVLATYDSESNKWKEVDNFLKYSADRIEINLIDNKIIQNENAKVKDSLLDWLVDNYVIDDGELT